MYRYGQKHPVTVFNVKVDSTSEAFADQRVYDYLEKKIDEVTKKLQAVQDGDPEDLRSEVLGQVATQLSLDDVYKTAVEEGRLKAEKAIDATTGQIAQIMADPKGMLGLFKGLERFDITDYQKVAARVSSDHLGFFVNQYLGSEGSQVKRSSEDLLSFAVPKRLAEVANKAHNADPYHVQELLKESVVERATVDKKKAQVTRGCRLLRFGDAAFDAMVRHVQHGGFSDAVASLEIAPATLRWPANAVGTWVLFDLRVVRQEGTMGGARVLRHELASYLVPRGREPEERADIVECLHEATDGPLVIEKDEAKRAYDAARVRANERLKAIYDDVVREYETAIGILPEEVRDVALAWVAAQ